eukprot:362979-Chlamydomonas_euryale.AAC.2
MCPPRRASAAPGCNCVSLWCGRCGEGAAGAQEPACELASLSFSSFMQRAVSPGFNVMTRLEHTDIFIYRSNILLSCKASLLGGFRTS